MAGIGAELPRMPCRQHGGSCPEADLSRAQLQAGAGRFRTGRCGAIDGEKKAFVYRATGTAYANLRAEMGGDWFGVLGRPVPGSNAWSRGARCSPPVSSEMKNIAAGSNTEQHG